MKQFWERQIPSHIQSRGKSYYLSGSVLDPKYEKDGNKTHITAKVSGTSLYNVEIHLDSDVISSAECSCPYAEMGDFCKHTAAVLFKYKYDMEVAASQEKRRLLEEEQARRIRERKPMDAFAHEDNSYHYFDLKRLCKNIVVYDLDYKDALKLAESRKNEFNIDFYYKTVGQYRELYCQASFLSSSIRFTREKLDSVFCYDYRCSYAESRLRSGSEKSVVCIHNLANLILIDRYLKEHNDFDLTDYEGIRMFNAFKGSSAQQSLKNDEENTGQIQLMPRLVLKNNGFSLSFRIGKNKLYAIKNMTTLVENVRNHKTMELGKDASINFLTDSFDPISQKYFRFISGCVDEMTSLSDKSTSKYKYIPDITSEMEIIGSNIDALFEISREGTAEFVNKQAGNKSKVLRFTYKEPQLKLSIKKYTDEYGVFHGISLNGHLPEFISGGSAQYFIEEEEKTAFLCKVPPELTKKLEPLEQVGLHGDVDVHIGRNHLSEFYWHILPVLEEIIDIDEPDAEYIDSQMPPKAEFAIYLDAINRTPVLKLEASYKTEQDEIRSFNAFDFILKNSIDPIRDSFREKTAMDMVLKYFDFIDPSSGLAFINDGEDQLFNLLEHGLKEFTAFCQVQSTSAFDALRVRSLPKVKVGVSIESDLLNLNISTVEISAEELLDILKSYKIKKRYHRLKNGEFIKIDEDIAELSAMVDALHLSPKEFIKGNIQIPAYRALYLDKMLENLSSVYAGRDKHFKQLIKDFKSVNESDFDAPASLEHILRPYQTYGYKWLMVLSSLGFGGILADDMGLGKTIQMIAVLSAAAHDGKGTSLIICPASLIYNWGEEFERFAPELKVGLLAGSRSERSNMLKSYTDYNVLVTSYDLLKRDAALYEDKSFEYQVLDEAQYIKTHTTAAAKSVKIIKSRHRFALTGTPIENRLSELWSIFDFLMPGFLYSYDVFKKEIETAIVKNSDQAASEKLKRMVSPFILRRLKSDVLKDLPEKLEEVRYACFEDEQQKIYDGQVVKMMQMLKKQSDDDINRNKIEILAELTRTRQICCDPGLLFDDYTGGSAKRAACLELIKSAVEAEHKILLFSQFTSMLELLEADLTAEGIKYYKITGATAKQERINLVKAFNENDVPLFLISLKAGGTGLNLTGADIVIHYDPWWNLAAQNQATDRAHRIGQTKTVCVYKLIIRNSIEEKILQMQQAKEKLADEILSGESAGISGMSREDLLKLLS